MFSLVIVLFPSWWRWGIHTKYAVTAINLGPLNFQIVWDD